MESILEETEKSILPLPTETQSSIEPSHLVLTLNTKAKKPKKLKMTLDKVSRENKDLNDLIKQKNAEIASLKKSSSSLNEIINTIPYDNVHYGPAAANYKLIEISNKNRKLSIELVTTKSKLTKKELQIQRNQNDLQTLERRLKLNEKHDEHSKNEHRKNTSSELKTQITELRQQNNDLKCKIQAATQCLRQETGHAWDIDEFIANPTNWHGRAEKIKNLEQEIEQYNEQLEGYKKLLEQEQSVRSGERMQFMNMSPRSEPTHESSIKSNNLKNQKMFETENALLKSELKKAKSKLLSLKVRNEQLNEELIKYLNLTNNMEQHNKFNNEHFTSLSEMLVQQQDEYDARVLELNDTINSLKLQLDHLNYEKQTLNSKLSIVETMLREKYTCIEKLLETNKKLEIDLKSFCGGFLFSCRDLRKEEFVAVLAALEAEKESLLKKIDAMADTIKEQNIKNDKLNEVNKEQRIEITHLECQLENALSKKGRVVKFPNDLKIAVSKTISEESMHELKVKLKIAETTIDELNTRLKSLEAEESRHLEVFAEMANKTKDTILETIRKFRTCSSN